MIVIYVFGFIAIASLISVMLEQGGIVHSGICPKCGKGWEDFSGACSCGYIGELINDE